MNKEIIENSTNEEILSLALEYNIITDEVFSALSVNDNRVVIVKLGYLVCDIYDLGVLDD